MPRERKRLANFDEKNSSDDEGSIVDEDVCSKDVIEKSFCKKYTIKSEDATSLKKIYILNLTSDKSFNRIAAGLSNGAVQIIDLDTNNGGLTNKVTINYSKPVDENLCGLHFLDESSNNILVGTDKEIKLFDLRTDKVQHIFEVQDKIERKKKSITCFDINSNSRVICAGTEERAADVDLLFFDTRERVQCGGYYESHEDDITQIKFHPIDPDCLSTGSTDGLINLFDIKQGTEEDALISTINTESSVQKINWLKNVYDKDIVSCITHTNDLKLYEKDEGDLIAEFERTKITEAFMRKTVCECNLINCHNMDDGNIFLLTASNFNKGEVLRSLKLQNKSLIPFGNFEKNKQIVRESIYSSKHDVLVTSGESGIITIWSPEANQNSAIESGKIKTKSSKLHTKKPY